MSASYSYVVILAVTLITSDGCSKNEGKPNDFRKNVATSTAGVAIHSHGYGPNNGIVFNLGNRHHVELTSNRDTREIYVLFLGSDEMSPARVRATHLLLNTTRATAADGQAVPPMAITLLPQDQSEGKASRFVGRHPGIKMITKCEGMISGEVNGQPAVGEFTSY